MGSIKVYYQAEYIIYGIAINGELHGSRIGRNIAEVELDQNEDIKRVTYSKRSESKIKII